ncbi:MAG: MgtC/SapB family protein [Clostridia bacterium]|nr:MgtC/SapB family protein [Clostridia bacterium]
MEILLTYIKLDVWQVLIRCAAAIIVGAVIGSERAKHGRAAGMRTHILVCLGATMTALTGLYITEIMGMGGDVSRIAAQVISGVGFLGAGMIVLKSNSVITGLTTAAGVWTTATIGIAIGYGFYLGASIVTLLFILAVVLFAKFEKHKKNVGSLYIEIDDMYKVNEIIEKLGTIITNHFSYQIIAPKSAKQGNLGIELMLEKMKDVEIENIKSLENVVFAVEE